MSFTQFYADTYFIYTLAADYAVISAAAELWQGTGHIFLKCLVLDLLCTVFFSVFGIYAALSYITLAAAVFLCLAPKNAREFAAMLMTVFIAAFVLGSLSLGLMSLFGANEFIMLIPAAFMIFITKKLAKSKRLSEISGIYPLVIEHSGKKAVFTALADSGNGLKVNGKEVIIIDKAAAGELISETDETFFTDCVSVTGRKRLLCFYAAAVIGEKRIENACIAISAEKIEGNFNALFNKNVLE